MSDNDNTNSRSLTPKSFYFVMEPTIWKLTQCDDTQHVIYTSNNLADYKDKIVKLNDDHCYTVTKYTSTPPDNIVNVTVVGDPYNDCDDCISYFYYPLTRCQNCYNNESTFLDVIAATSDLSMYAAGTVLKLSDGICYTLGNIVYPRLQPTTNPVTVLGTYSACSSCPENSTVTLVISGISLCTGCYATGDIITYDGQDPLGFVTWGDSITGFNGYASGTGSSIFDAPYGPPSWSAALNGGSISYYSKLYQENCQANGYSFGGPAVGYPEIYLTLVGNVLTAEIRGVTPYYNSYRIFHGSTTLTSCRSVVITNDLTCSGAPGWDYRYDNDHPELCYYWPNAGSGGTITISLE